jgi:cell division protease FtsH
VALGQVGQRDRHLPVDERHLYSEGYLLDRLAISMGGRVAEKIVLGQCSTGAANDLNAATKIAIKMVREFGMSPLLGPIGFSEEGPNFLGEDGAGFTKPYAEETQNLIDEEVRRMLAEAERHAHDLLSEHRGALDLLSEKLIEEETIDGSEVYVVLTEAGAGSALGGRDRDDADDPYSHMDDLRTRAVPRG